MLYRSLPQFVLGIFVIYGLSGCHELFTMECHDIFSIFVAML
jgi:hypothetical protein